jgi:hypothetical protein
MYFLLGAIASNAAMFLLQLLPIAVSRFEQAEADSE